MTKLPLVILFFTFTYSATADSILLVNGKTLNNVKITVKKDFVEILHENGKKEIRKKSDFKKSKIKFKSVSWNEKNSPENKQKIKDIRQSKITQQMLVLEKQREVNFAMSQKVIEERKKHDFLMKERIRLQYTEGFLSYAGGQSIYTEIMEKNGSRYYVRNPYGLLYFTLSDFGDEIIIETDKGKERIDIAKMLAVKEEKYQNGYIYLAGGEKFKGIIAKSLGDQVVLNTPKGELKLTASEILFPSIPKPNKINNQINIKEGEYASFLFNNGETVTGKLIKMSKNLLFIETQYGTLEMDSTNLDSIKKEISSK